MSDSTTLKYVAADLEDMHEPDTCTVRRCRRADGSRYWRLWFVVRNDVGESAGMVVLLTIGLNVGGPYVEDDGSSADGGKLWGFVRAAPGTWQVLPSVDVADVWHHTPKVVNVPEPAPWT